MLGERSLKVSYNVRRTFDVTKNERSQNVQPTFHNNQNTTKPNLQGTFAQPKTNVPRTFWEPKIVSWGVRTEGSIHIQRCQVTKYKYFVTLLK